MGRPRGGMHRSRGTGHGSRGGMHLPSATVHRPRGGTLAPRAIPALFSWGDGAFRRGDTLFSRGRPSPRFNRVRFVVERCASREGAWVPPARRCVPPAHERIAPAGGPIPPADGCIAPAGGPISPADGSVLRAEVTGPPLHGCAGKRGRSTPPVEVVVVVVVVSGDGDGEGPGGGRSRRRPHQGQRQRPRLRLATQLGWRCQFKACHARLRLARSSSRNYLSLLAEREGFEPSVPLRVHMISNHAPSATRSSLRSAARAAARARLLARPVRARRGAREGGLAAASSLTTSARPATFRRGELSEWPKEPDSKSGVPVRVPWVRIPRSPQVEWLVRGPCPEPLLATGVAARDGIPTSAHDGGRRSRRDSDLCALKRPAPRSVFPSAAPTRTACPGLNCVPDASLPRQLSLRYRDVRDADRRSLHDE